MSDLGLANWIWDDHLRTHIPTCSRWRVNYDGRVVRCDNGPLEEAEIAEGTCSVDTHLPRESHL